MKNKVYTGEMRKSVAYGSVRSGAMFKLPGENEVWLKTDIGRIAVGLIDGGTRIIDNALSVITFRPGTTIHIDQGE